MNSNIPLFQKNIDESFKTYDKKNDERITMSCRKALEEAFESYEQAMNNVARGDQALASDSLEAAHERKRDEAVKSFRHKNQYGSNKENITVEYEDKLIEVGCFGRRFRSLVEVLYL